MSTFQLQNGEFHSSNSPLLQTSNRGFCYGDGFFESMKISNGKAPFIALHWKRLEKVCSFLRIQIDESLNLQSFNRFALELVHKNGFRNARIRFQGYRIGTGRYSPDENKLGWTMVCEPTHDSDYALNKHGLHLDVCTSHQINPAPQSSFKTSNSLPYVLGGIFAKEKGLDDCFLIDAEGSIAEATGSNVFLVKGNKILTPNLSAGGVAGVMRSVVIQEAEKCNLTITKGVVKIEDVLMADECFLTNASRGIQWVGAVRKKRYFKKVSSNLIQHINEEFDLIS